MTYISGEPEVCQHDIVFQSGDDYGQWFCSECGVRIS